MQEVLELYSLNQDASTSSSESANRTTGGIEI